MDLDDIDKGILFLLQRDARDLTIQEMAEHVDVSASTVRNRIERLESEGVVRGYQPIVDYDRAGFQLYVQIICSAPNPQREELAEAALDVGGVIAVREVLNGQENIQIEAVGTTSDDVARITDELTRIGLDVVNTKIIKESYTQPFNHFGSGIADGDEG
ncbi:Lrp/AsnC family transcriptional regulator [Haloarcula litorea]|uniref:Lrp/AsnC family transcriptional regulator n=1 Tax=Haloarcula litorea TaxID=3032579 RepID=UPI0023E7F1D8|nr:Lrp/AsnC family transcriptional regulator [Halomicroarcula sp. GDY20]